LAINFHSNVGIFRRSDFWAHHLSRQIRVCFTLLFVHVLTTWHCSISSQQQHICTSWLKNIEYVVLIAFQIAFLVLTICGTLIPLVMVDPQKIIRTDCTNVTTARHPSWRVEIYGLWVAVRDDPLIIMLFPMFFSSNWFYTWRKSFVVLFLRFGEWIDLLYRIQRLQRSFVQYPSSFT
jgi:hypothetical protein